LHEALIVRQAIDASIVERIRTNEHGRVGRQIRVFQKACQCVRGNLCCAAAFNDGFKEVYCHSGISLAQSGPFHKDDR
jgi:hypothetical protein